MNKTINNKMKKKVKRTRLTEYSFGMYQCLRLKIVSKVKLSSFQLLMIWGTKEGSCKFCFISLDENTEWLTWKYQEDGVCNQKLFPSKQNHKEVIHKNSHESSADSCNSEWLYCALEALQKNDIYCPYLTAAVLRLLQMGHKKRIKIFLLFAGPYLPTLTLLKLGSWMIFFHITQGFTKIGHKGKKLFENLVLWVYWKAPLNCSFLKC